MSKAQQMAYELENAGKTMIDDDPRWVLGKQTPAASSPEDFKLATIDNKAGLTWNGIAYAIRLSCPEFTSLCPITNQPDFAHIVIDYIPKDKLIESKSLKLFLGSFRNHGSYHEDCTVFIGARLAAELMPLWLRVSAFWFPRGGIPIDVFWQTGDMPPHVFLPPLDIPVYRAR